MWRAPDHAGYISGRRVRAVAVWIMYSLGVTCRVVVLVVAGLVAGCTLQRRPLTVSSLDAGPREDAAPIDVGAVEAGPDADPIDVGPVDAEPIDAGERDAGPPDAGPPDAGPPDTGPPDAGPPDAGPPDAGPPDAGPPDAGPPLRRCDAIYGTVSSYRLCAERATECEFYLNPEPDSTCDAVCGIRGGGCVAAYNDGVADDCIRSGDLTCGGVYDHPICVCARIP